MQKQNVTCISLLVVFSIYRHCNKTDHYRRPPSFPGLGLALPEDENWLS